MVSRSYRIHTGTQVVNLLTPIFGSLSGSRHSGNVCLSREGAGASRVIGHRAPVVPSAPRFELVGPTGILNGVVSATTWERAEGGVKSRNAKESVVLHISTRGEQGHFVNARGLRAH